MCESMEESPSGLLGCVGTIGGVRVVLGELSSRRSGRDELWCNNGGCEGKLGVGGREDCGSASVESDGVYSSSEYSPVDMIKQLG